jgi:topoisomerase-4 subunit B
MQRLGGKVEITRFKGLGEISPDEFGAFIGENIRLQPVLLHDSNLHKILEFYMGKNTPTRQEFIIDNLRVELDKIDKEDEEKIVLEEHE